MPPRRRRGPARRGGGETKNDDDDVMADLIPNLVQPPNSESDDDSIPRLLSNPRNLDGATSSDDDSDDFVPSGPPVGLPLPGAGSAGRGRRQRSNFSNAGFRHLGSLDGDDDDDDDEDSDDDDDSIPELVAPNDRRRQQQQPRGKQGTNNNDNGNSYSNHTASVNDDDDDEEEDDDDDDDGSSVKSSRSSDSDDSLPELVRVRNPRHVQGSGDDGKQRQQKLKKYLHHDLEDDDSHDKTDDEMPHLIPRWELKDGEQTPKEPSKVALHLFGKVKDADAYAVNKPKAATRTEANLGKDSSTTTTTTTGPITPGAAATGMMSGTTQALDEEMNKARSMKIREMKAYLQQQGVGLKGLVEKNDLVNAVAETRIRNRTKEQRQRKQRKVG